MLNTDEDALLCDFAQYYNIYDIEELGLIKLSIFAWGLPDDSRSKKLMSKQKVSLETYLQAQAVDALNMLVWSKTKDGQHNRNRPKSIAQSLLPKQKVDDNHQNFASGKEFEKARKQIVKEVAKSNG